LPAAIIVAGSDNVAYLQTLPGMHLHQLEHIECLVCNVNYLKENDDGVFQRSLLFSDLNSSAARFMSTAAHMPT